MEKKEVLVIIPAYNEESNIVKVLDDLERPEIAGITDVLVMNDASSDATNWIVKARGHALVTHVQPWIWKCAPAWLQICDPARL